uniref:F-box/kelch-repeat protein n=1 Tax=Noccaea caerulescens TaxID=107243 RepID=A0A1J3G038_NOCCA
MPTTRICDLPRKLIGEKILTRIPVTSLRQVRSTCKSWDALTKSWILGASTEQFLGFMTMNSKVFSLRFRVKQKGGLVDLSIHEVELLNKFDISQVFHCQGILLCVTKNKSKLVVWNPYLNQTRLIKPRRKFHVRDRYALGYDINDNHKILRFWDRCPGSQAVCEIYNLSCDSWKVLDVTTDWDIEYFRRGVSVKGNAYFYAHDKCDAEIGDFLVCFDFTREKFGPRLCLPFHICCEECVTLSCVGVGDEQLAVLYYEEAGISGILEIWVTTMIEPDCVSWSNFLKVDLRPFSHTGGVRFDESAGGSFFVDEQEKVAVVFDLDGDLDGYLSNKTPRYQTAFIIGEDGLFESVCLGEAPNLGVRCPTTGHIPQLHVPLLVCSSPFRPSLVSLLQVNQPQLKRQRRCV